MTEAIILIYFSTFLLWYLYCYVPLFGYMADNRGLDGYAIMTVKGKYFIFKPCKFLILFFLPALIVLIIIYAFAYVFQIIKTKSVEHEAKITGITSFAIKFFYNGDVSHTPVYRFLTPKEGEKK